MILKNVSLDHRPRCKWCIELVEKSILQLECDSESSLDLDLLESS